MAASALGAAFEPYDLAQVHATIVGLEHIAGSIGRNANFRTLRGRSVEMDIPRFLDALRESSLLPLVVRFGGFAQTDSPFLSRGARPYPRSFSVQGEKVVLMGWPWRAGTGGGPGDFPHSLDAVRRSAQGFGILHAYHRAQSDLDNDLFLRLGTIRRDDLDDDRVADLEERVRLHLSRMRPLVVRIGFDDLRVVCYRDERLPLASTLALPLSSPDLARILRGDSDC
jgi:hypothetical protein